MCTPMFTALLFKIPKILKQSKYLSVGKWIKNLCYIYRMEYDAAKRKKELLPFVTVCMELNSIMLSEISQVVKDKYHIMTVRGT